MQTLHLDCKCIYVHIYIYICTQAHAVYVCMYVWVGIMVSAFCILYVYREYVVIPHIHMIYVQFAGTCHHFHSSLFLRLPLRLAGNIGGSISLKVNPTSALPAMFPGRF